VASTESNDQSSALSSAPLSHGPYPELTGYAIFVGYFLGVIIAISIGYASLKLGFSIEGSELAAILGFGILRGILRRRSIIENNVSQTVASAVNGASSGLMFSVPAIFILGYGTELNPYFVAFGAICGAFLGIAFIIPLRKQMIDFERLTYPGGVAVATILKSPGVGIEKAKLLVGAMIFSGFVHVVALSFGIHDLHVGDWLNIPDDFAYLNLMFYASLMTVGVAFIAGRGGLAFIVGGFVCYFFLAPILDITGMLPLDEQGNKITDANTLRLTLFRPSGIGMLIGGAVIGVVFAVPLIRSAIKSMQNSAKVESAMSRDEMPIKLLYVAVIGAAILLMVRVFDDLEGKPLTYHLSN
jgi:putative OPT family oligopeptide transporter